MFRPRIIPVLLYRNGGLVKSIRFTDHRYIGDPINAVRIFNDCFADELIILDIEASKKGQPISTELVREVGEEANMPFAVGGGITTLDQIAERLRMGAEKVVLNSVGLNSIPFVRDAVSNFGSSTITACVDVKKNLLGRYQLYSHSMRKSLSPNWREHIRMLEDAGVGELILQSVDMDGTMRGYDANLYKELASELNMPLVALGGVGSYQDIFSLSAQGPVNGFAAGSLFVYYGPMKGVLINYSKVNCNAFPN